MTPSITELDRMLERVTAHLRVNVAELRRLERDRAPSGQIDERRRVVSRLQAQLAELVKGALGPPRSPHGAGS